MHNSLGSVKVWWVSGSEQCFLTVETAETVASSRWQLPVFSWQCVMSHGHTLFLTLFCHFPTLTRSGGRGHRASLGAGSVISCL